MRKYLFIILFLFGLQGVASLFSQNQSLDYCFELLNNPKKVSAAQLCFIGMIETLERQNLPDSAKLSRAYAGLAKVYFIKEDLQTAKSKAKKALALNRKNLEAILLRAQIASKEENDSEAKRWFLTADDLAQGKNNQVRFRLAKIYEKEGNLESVLQFLVNVPGSAAQQLYLESAEKYYLEKLTKFYMELNKPDEKSKLATFWFEIIGDLKKYPINSSRINAKFDEIINEVIQELEVVPNSDSLRKILRSALNLRKNNPEIVDLYFNTKQKVAQKIPGTDVGRQIEKLRKFNSRYFKSHIENLALDAKVLLPEVDAERRWDEFSENFKAKKWSDVPNEFHDLVQKYPGYLKWKLPAQNPPDSICFRLCEIHFEVAPQIPLWPQYQDMLNSVIEQSQTTEKKHRAIFYLGLSTSRDSTKESTAVSYFRSILQENPEFKPPYFHQSADVRGRFLFARACVNEIDALTPQPFDSLFLNQAEKYLNEILNLKPDFSPAIRELAFLRKVFPFWRIYWDGLQSAQVDDPKAALKPFRMFAAKTAADSGRVADYLKQARQELERRQPDWTWRYYSLFILIVIFITAIGIFRHRWHDWLVQRMLKKAEKFSKTKLLITHSINQLKIQNINLEDFQWGDLQKLRKKIQGQTIPKPNQSLIKLQDFSQNLNKRGFITKLEGEGRFSGDKSQLINCIQLLSDLSAILFDGIPSTSGKMKKSKKTIHLDVEKGMTQLAIDDFSYKVPHWIIWNYSAAMIYVKRIIRRQGGSIKLIEPSESPDRSPVKGKNYLRIILKN